MRTLADFWARTRALVIIELQRSCQSRSTWLAAGAMLVIAVLVSLGATHSAAATDVPNVAQEARTALGGVASLRVFAVLLGVLCVTSQYHHGDIVWRYLAEPSRVVQVTAKAVACAVIGALLGLAALQVAAMVTLVNAGGNTGGLGLSSAATARMVVGSVVGWALAGVLGVGIGAAVRNQTAAVVGTLVAVLVVEPVLTAMAPKVAAFLPSALAGAAAGEVATVSWAVALVLFAGYAMAAAFAGGLVCARQDI